MGCLPVNFQETKRPLKLQSGKRPVEERKRPMKTMVLVSISVGCLMGCFRAPPPWRKTAPPKRPIQRSMRFDIARAKSQEFPQKERFLAGKSQFEIASDFPSRPEIAMWHCDHHGNGRFFTTEARIKNKNFMRRAHSNGGKSCFMRRTEEKLQQLTLSPLLDGS